MLSAETLFSAGASLLCPTAICYPCKGPKGLLPTAIRDITDTGRSQCAVYITFPQGPMYSVYIMHLSGKQYENLFELVGDIASSI